jgi:hypothetical protein
MMQFCNGYDKGTAIKFCAHLRKRVMETLAMIRQPFQDECMSSTWKVQNKKGETCEEQSQEHVNHFLQYQGDCSQKWHCIKMCKDFAPKLVTTYMTVILHSPYFSVSPTEDKTERPPFLHN